MFSGEGHPCCWDLGERIKCLFKLLLFSSGEELLDSDKDIDILFLDIQMKRLDGIETAKKMRSRGYKGFLIFITVLKEMVFLVL